MGFSDWLGLTEPKKKRKAKPDSPRAATSRAARSAAGRASAAPSAAPTTRRAADTPPMRPAPKSNGGTVESSAVTLAVASRSLPPSGPASQGQYCVIGKDVHFGEGVHLGHHVIIHANSVIGNFVSIADGTIIGKQPQKAARSATTTSEPLPPAVIGDDVRIGANSVIYAGAQIGPRAFVADLATVRERVTIGEATIVGRGVAIENQCSIGARCKLETNVYITAYSTVGDDVFLAPGVLTSNDNYVGRDKERFTHFRGVTVQSGGRLGVGSVVLPGKTIARDSLVAAAALVTKDTEPEMIHAGVPAKPLRKVDEKQLLRNQ